MVNRWLAVVQPLVVLPPVARMSTGNVRRVFPRDTYKTMLAEDFTPAGIAQTRKEFRAVAEAVHKFRAKPPVPPACPIVVLSASRPLRRGSDQELIAEYQRRYVDSLPNGRFEQVDSSHFIQAEQPAIVADHVRYLLDQVTQTTPGRPADHP